VVVQVIAEELNTVDSRDRLFGRRKVTREEHCGSVTTVSTSVHAVEGDKDIPNVTYPQSSPFFNPGKCRISKGGSLFEYMT
jgi:hypothetical protein